MNDFAFRCWLKPRNVCNCEELGSYAIKTQNFQQIYKYFCFRFTYSFLSAASSTQFFSKLQIWLSVAQSRCEMAKDESIKLRTVCYNLLDSSSGSGDLHQELKALIKQIKNRPVRFTAADFFEIKRSTTFTIVGATATYFIVYVELRSNDNTAWNNGTL